MRTVAERLEQYSHPEPMSGCWLWFGYTSTAGYGLIHVAGRMRQAHRISYELAKGPIAQGLEMDHLCRTRSCINPDHLEAVTRSVNTLRGIGPALIRARSAARTACNRGHLYTADNTRIYTDKRGNLHRVCITCHDRTNRTYNLKVSARTRALHKENTDV
jgi:HNH endonuclease